LFVFFVAIKHIHDQLSQRESSITIEERVRGTSESRRVRADESEERRQRAVRAMLREKRERERERERER